MFKKHFFFSPYIIVQYQGAHIHQSEIRSNYASHVQSNNLANNSAIDQTLLPYFSAKEISKKSNYMLCILKETYFLSHLLSQIEETNTRKLSKNSSTEEEDKIIKLQYKTSTRCAKWISRIKVIKVVKPNLVFSLPKVPA